VTPSNLLYGSNLSHNLIEKRCIEYAIRRVDSIVVQTERQAEYLAQHYGRGADAIVPNFHPEPQEAIRKDGPLSVVWVANLKPWKQPEIFVRLAGGLRDLGDVRFIMVGTLGGGKGWRESLLRSIERAPNLDYVGAKTQDEVNELLARAHVFVNTSVEEGYPNTFIQAWQRQVPVVSLSVNPDGVFDRESIGIHAGSEQGLGAAVRLLLTDRALRDQYGAQASEYAKRHHSLRNTRALIRLIETGEVDAESMPKRIRVARRAAY
jgi:glycosyltransferase involved in cell wall biosynthesis